MRVTSVSSTNTSTHRQNSLREARPAKVAYLDSTELMASPKVIAGGMGATPSVRGHCGHLDQHVAMARTGRAPAGQVLAAELSQRLTQAISPSDRRSR